MNTLSNLFRLANAAHATTVNADNRRILTARNARRIARKA